MKGQGSQNVFPTKLPGTPLTPIQYCCICCFLNLKLDKGPDTNITHTELKLALFQQLEQNFFKLTVVEKKVVTSKSCVVLESRSEGERRGRKKKSVKVMFLHVKIS